MDILEAIKKRHSVREYTNQRLNEKVAGELQEFIEQINDENGFDFSLVLNQETALNKNNFNYGDITNCKNFVALFESDNKNKEKVGYYGEKIVLKAQQLGLNTCWLSVALGKAKKIIDIKNDRKLKLIIALGYGANQGVEHKSKDISKLSFVDGTRPQWFENGMEAAMLAPTAMNQQKFLFILKGNKVKAKALIALYSKYDLGIVKCHFEIGAGLENFSWEE